MLVWLFSPLGTRGFGLWMFELDILATSPGWQCSLIQSIQITSWVPLALAFLMAWGTTQLTVYPDMELLTNHSSVGFTKDWFELFHGYLLISSLWHPFRLWTVHSDTGSQINSTFDEISLPLESWVPFQRTLGQLAIFNVSKTSSTLSNCAINRTIAIQDINARR